MRKFHFFNNITPLQEYVFDKLIQVTSNFSKRSTKKVIGRYFFISNKIIYFQEIAIIILI